MKERIENKKAESELWLAKAFGQNPHALQDQAFLKDYRKRQWDQFSARGLPTRREEAWKYADFSFMEKSEYPWPEAYLEVLSEQGPLQGMIKARAEDSNLIVFINGYFAPQFSSVEELGEGVILSNRHEALEKHAALLSPYLLSEVDVKKHPLSSLNAALMADGLFIYLPPAAALKKPLHILSIAQGASPFMTQPRHLLILERDSELSLIDEHLSIDADHYFSNTHTDCFVGKNARLNYYKVQNEAKHAKHSANVFFHQKQNSQVNACSFAIGSQFSRNDFTATLQEPGAVCRVNGFYGLDADGQMIDHHLHIDHAAPHTQSVMDFRGILARQCRAVFNGKVLARPGAKKVEALQFNHNVLLSALAEVDTKPELEIYVDDVQCRHGATVGQIDEEALFYLRTRGIERKAAKMMLLQALMENVLCKVTLPGLVRSMHEQWARCLERLD